ncbi:MAG: hypothetical protein Q4G08_05870 [Capnocytophaga sp.]|nr:hypothetical protein [Capnocytophaga sp.]
MLKVIHSYWAYIVLIVLLVAAANAIIGFFSKKEFTHKDFRISLFGLIATHIQFLIGLILYFVSPLFGSWSAGGAKLVMKDSYLRKMLVEHPLMILIAVVLITIGWSLHKKQLSDQRKFGKIALFYTIGLVLILAVIPWNVWLP